VTAPDGGTSLAKQKELSNDSSFCGSIEGVKTNDLEIKSYFQLLEISNFLNKFVSRILALNGQRL
jgi:hypothetical protein